MSDLYTRLLVVCESIIREICQAAGWWACSFGAFMTYWQIEELIEPGQQYSDPVWPCAWIALLAVEGVLLAHVLLALCGIRPIGGRLPRRRALEPLPDGSTHDG